MWSQGQLSECDVFLMNLFQFLLSHQVLGGSTGGRVGPKGEPGYPGTPGLKGERGPSGKHRHKTFKHITCNQVVLVMLKVKKYQ